MTSASRTLNFHGIGMPGDTIDAGEKPYWIDRAFFEELVVELARRRDSHPVFITFDDGNKSDLEIAAPFLARHGLQARFFVLTGRLDMPGYLDRDDVRALRDMGFLIGSHGQDHLHWNTLASNDLERETQSSKHVLETVLNEPVTEAAIPFGDYNRGVLTALRRAGYSAAWTSDGGDMDPAAFVRPRMSVRSDMTLQSVSRALFDPISPIRRVRRALAMARKRYL